MYARDNELISLLFVETRSRDRETRTRHSKAAGLPRLSLEHEDKECVDGSKLNNKVKMLTFLINKANQTRDRKIYLGSRPFYRMSFLLIACGVKKYLIRI